jgi:pyruvate dehydrogenase E2 component (dihydrolipoamide acetyltransferase)
VTDLQTPPPEPEAPVAAPEGPAAPAAGRKGATEVEPLPRPHALLARRTAESRATVPDVTYAVEVDMGEAEGLRAQLAALGPAPAAAPAAGDLAIRACALALRDHPQANGAYKDGAWERYARVNLGVVVPGVPASVPTLFDADRKDVRTLAAERRTLEERVRSGTATPPELSGATFTVADLSAHGVRDFVPVVPLGQAGVLAVGAVEARPVVRAGAVVPGHTLRLTLACDHRILHGADAAAFLRRVRELLEEPLVLVLPAGKPRED